MSSSSSLLCSQTVISRDWKNVFQETGPAKKEDLDTNIKTSLKGCPTKSFYHEVH